MPRRSEWFARSAGLVAGQSVPARTQRRARRGRHTSRDIFGRGSFDQSSHTDKTLNRPALCLEHVIPSVGAARGPKVVFRGAVRFTDSAGDRTYYSLSQRRSSVSMPSRPSVVLSTDAERPHNARRERCSCADSACITGQLS